MNHIETLKELHHYYYKGSADESRFVEALSHAISVLEKGDFRCSYCKEQNYESCTACEDAVEDEAEKPAEEKECACHEPWTEGVNHNMKTCFLKKRETPFQKIEELDWKNIEIPDDQKPFDVFIEIFGNKLRELIKSHNSLGEKMR